MLICKYTTSSSKKYFKVEIIFWGRVILKSDIQLSNLHIYLTKKHIK
jgi:hypothetical protein